MPFNRRDFLKTSGMGLASWFIDPNAFPSLDENVVKVEPINGFAYDQELQERLSLQTAIQDAIDKSVETGQRFVVELQPGDFTYRQTIEIDAKPNSNIVIKGAEEGTALKVDRNRADAVPEKDWKGNGVSNLIKFKFGENAQVAFEKVNFSGGLSEEKLLNHYAPLSPWDSIILAVGNDNVYSLKGPQRGSISFDECNFDSSICCGACPVGLENFSMNKCKGEYMDSIAAVTYCKNTRITETESYYMLSDGLFATACENIDIERTHVAFARQGFDFHGCHYIKMRECSTRDALHHMDVVNPPWVNKGKTISVIDIERVDGDRAMIGYVFDNVEGKIKDCQHRNVGVWPRDPQVDPMYLRYDDPAAFVSPDHRYYIMAYWRTEYSLVPPSEKYKFPFYEKKIFPPNVKVGYEDVLFKSASNFEYNAPEDMTGITISREEVN